MLSRRSVFWYSLFTWAFHILCIRCEEGGRRGKDHDDRVKVSPTFGEMLPGKGCRRQHAKKDERLWLSAITGAISLGEVIALVGGLNRHALFVEPFFSRCPHWLPFK